MKKTAILLFIILIFKPLYAWFSNGSAGYAGEYLTSFTGGARGSALGFAQTAASEKADIITSNPAGLSGLWWREVNFNFTPLFLDSEFISFSYGYPVNDDRVYGLSLIRLSSGEAEKTSTFGESLGTFKNGETAVVLCVSQKINSRLSAGVSPKFVFQSIDDYSARGAGLDAGIRYAYAKNHIWGVSVLNLLPAKLGPDTFPVIVKAGFLRRIINNKLGLYSDASVYDLFTEGSTHLRWASGIEYKLLDYFSLRSGINEKQVSLGFGLSFIRSDFDYAFIYNPLGFIHSFSLSIRYGFVPTRAEKEVEIEFENLKYEKDEYLRRKSIEKEKIKAEREKLAAQKRISLKFLEAKKYYEEKNFVSSKRVLEGILAEVPNDPESTKLNDEVNAMLNSATIIRRLKDARSAYVGGRYSEALRNINIVLEIDRTNVNALVLEYLSKAQLYIKDKQYKNAKGELIEALKIDASNQEATGLLKRIQAILDLYSD